MAGTYRGVPTAAAAVRAMHERYAGQWPTECLFIPNLKLKPKGYAEIKFPGERRSVAVHRYMWFIAHGRWPEDTIDHVKARGCSGGACVNLDHLEEVTRSENAFRRWGSSLQVFQCGHDRTPENTSALESWYAPRGLCRTCINARQNERNRLRRAS